MKIRTDTERSQFVISSFHRPGDLVISRLTEDRFHVERTYPDYKHFLLMRQYKKLTTEVDTKHTCFSLREQFEINLVHRPNVTLLLTFVNQLYQSVFSINNKYQ